MFLIGKDYWEIRQTKNKGLGVYACKPIAKGTIISDYLGKIVKYSEYDLELDKQGLYLMYYSDEFGIYPDLASPGPHLINHSCEPNCWIYIYQGHTLFYSLREINSGEEITINYLLGPDDKHVCLCGSENCNGTMQSSTRVQNSGSKGKVIPGQNLKPLPSYQTELVSR